MTTLLFAKLLILCVLGERTMGHPTECPPGVPVPSCGKDPCEDAKCKDANVLSAICSGYYCGGCLRKWKDANGKDVTEKCEGTPSI